MDPMGVKGRGGSRVNSEVNRSAKKPDLNLRSGFGYAAYGSVLYSHRRSFSSDMLGVVLESSHWFFKPLFLGI